MNAKSEIEKIIAGLPPRSAGTFNPCQEPELYNQAIEALYKLIRQSGEDDILEFADELCRAKGYDSAADMFSYIT